jgi:hypothetical protein
MIPKRLRLRITAAAETLQHPPDHPDGFTEAEYLKVIYLKFPT